MIFEERAYSVESVESPLEKNPNPQKGKTQAIISSLHNLFNIDLFGLEK